MPAGLQYNTGVNITYASPDGEKMTSDNGISAKMEYRTIDISGLELGAGAPFRFRWKLPGEEGSAAPDASLTESIAALGIISPPILVDTGNPFEVVSGFRRIAAAREAGLGEIPALVINARDEGHAAALSVWLESSPYGQPLSEMERLILAAKASAIAGDRITESLSFLSRLFGRKITPDVLGKLTSLSRLDADVRLAIHEGRVSPGNLLQVSIHPGINTEDAARLLAGSGLSRSGRREVVRGMLSMADYGKDLFAGFVKDYDPEKIPLGEAVRSITHPRMNDDISFLKRTISEIELPPAASVRLPENLEGNNFTVEIKVRDGDDLRITLARLHEALEDGLVESMLEVLQGRT